MASRLLANFGLHPFLNPFLLIQTNQISWYIFSSWYMLRVDVTHTNSHMLHYTRAQALNINGYIGCLVRMFWSLWLAIWQQSWPLIGWSPPSPLLVSEFLPTVTVTLLLSIYILGYNCNVIITEGVILQTLVMVIHPQNAHILRKWLN